VGKDRVILPYDGKDALRFEVKSGDDPVGTYLIVTVDIEDPDEVVDVCVEKLLALQVDEGLPLYIIPVRPLSKAG